MAVQADEPVPLPRAPPPRPAARQAAIDAALRKFDGREPSPTGSDVPRRRAGWMGWARTHQRAAGAFATAALVLVVSLPVGLGTLRESAPTSAPASPDAMAAAPACTGPDCASQQATPETADAVEERLAFEPPNSVAPAAVPPAAGPSDPQVADVRSDRVAARATSPAPAMVAAAPPAPAPPPSASNLSGADRPEPNEESDVVVTGSRVQRSNLSDGALAQASPLAVVDRRGEFMSDLRAALRSGDRRRVVQLTRLPLRVHRDGATETYRSATALERDFDRIFTPAVRASLADRGENRKAEAADSAVSVGRILIGPACEGSSCPPTSPLRITEVTP
ncbi:hypothetical protein [Sphingomonas arenae]|uniref:hypothetical protein n=1 Tax=Sphingomonas arenae TaxID=2812555 RepID=UPI00196840F0|nr:hypothetical protein [Sphingomonas arenae]